MEGLNLFEIDARTNKITLTRGDTAYLQIELQNYKAQEGDVLILTVGEDEHNTLFQTTTSATSGMFIIEPEATKEAECGRYLYDIQLNTVDDEIATVVKPTTFRIAKEITV